ncbi:uncharacterized protein LOC143485475 [Brachyhypopomus gauderio]|uniref:uncharacterized protein LOC143485475 n=1 Tax=Brachyhypopomus gauderio TaxID=698409 RepID=UPI004040F779
MVQEGNSEGKLEVGQEGRRRKTRRVTGERLNKRESNALEKSSIPAGSTSERQRTTQQGNGPGSSPDTRLQCLTAELFVASRSCSQPVTRKKQLSIETRQSILVLRNEVYSMRDIAKKLKISYNGVYYSFQRRAQTGSNQSRRRSGRPRCTTEQEDKYIRVSSLRNRRLTGPQLAASLNSTRKTPVSTSTVKRRLRDAGLQGRVAKKKPYLANKRKSEKMLEECMTPSVKHGGGNVMVWGCFGAGKVRDLNKVKGILNKEVYHSILQHHGIPCGQCLIGANFILQQDNDPKHTSKLCTNYLEKKQAAGVLSAKSDAVKATKWFLADSTIRDREVF